MQHFHRVVRPQGLPEVGIIGFPARGVDDHAQVFRSPGQHQVIDDSALRVGEQRIALPVRRQGADIAGYQAFHRLLDASPRQAHLSHVGNIEQAGAATGMEMLRHDPAPVLQRHFITGKGREPGALPGMQVVQRRFFQCGIHKTRIQDTQGNYMGVLNFKGARAGPGDRIRTGACKQRDIQLQAHQGYQRNTRSSRQRTHRGPWLRIHPSPACRLR